MPVLFEQHGAVGVVTLRRPEARNCWGDDFNEGLTERFAAMESDADIRCVVVTGDAAGRASPPVPT